jgi:hypothetical protein
MKQSGNHAFRRTASFPARASLRTRRDYSVAAADKHVRAPLWNFLCLVACLMSGLWSTAYGFDWEQAPGYRRAPLPVPASGKTGFTRLDPTKLGISFTNLLSNERSLTNRNLLSGSGIAAGDVDGDGLCDLYFCSLGHGNRLYRNLGSWQFEDITERAGVACLGQDSTGAVFADIDGDGDLDLLVNSFQGGTRVFENDGHGHFKEITAQSGVASKHGSTSMALADIDGDGDLDLYVANFRPTTVKDEPATRFGIRLENGRQIVATVNDRPVTEPDLTNRFIVTPSGAILEQGEPDTLFLNNGHGRFTPVSWTGGTFLDEDGRPLREAPGDWGLAVQFHDLNGDGAPDIYVCNDLHTPDRIWINDGHGRFRAIARTAIRSTSVFSMGVDMGDLNRDGNVDLFVVDMFSRDHTKQMVQVAGRSSPNRPVGLYDYRPQLNRNTLQISRGDLTFAETAYYSGVEASEWSWGPIFLDVDLDGYEDILIMNGQLRDFQNADLERRLMQMRNSPRLSMLDLVKLVQQFPSLNCRKAAFHNRGDLTFDEVGAAWGFDKSGISHGMALADLDNDGDLDLITNNLNDSPGLYRNETAAPRLAIRLKGLPPNTRGIGAQIRVLGGPVPQSQEMICGGRYLSGDDSMRVFAAGSLTNRLTIEIRWRDGKESRIENAAPNYLYEIDEASASANGPSLVASRSDPYAPHHRPPTTEHGPLFEDVSSKLRHVHHENEFDDFERQPLLPNRLSQLGPGVAWHDYDGDGWDDLLIGTGMGGHLAIYHNDRHGGFTPLLESPVNRPSPRDQTTVLGPALHTVLVGSSNYEDGRTNGGAIRIYDLNRHLVGDSVLGQPCSTGPLAMADVDGDGHLDLFIGGRVIPGRYPEPATSLLLLNQGGRLVIQQRWEKLGLVSGAVFSDLDGDGFPELILACEWGPVRVFKNEHGAFTEITERLGLSQFTGWWNGVTTADLDGDGRLDIIASNWGLNSRYKASPANPRRLYYGDFTGSGILSLIEAYYDADLKKIVPDRGYRAVTAALPFLQDKCPTFEAYGKAGVEELYGDQLPSATLLQATTLSSMVFFNRGDHFEAVPLPCEAQWAPAFGISVADFDGDGAEDVFLSQNFSATNPDNYRCDAGRGLLLKGDGQGGLQPVPGQISGIEVYGEQRGCAAGDYDGDGRVDLVVTQNGAETHLFHNLGAKPGLRVRLQGGAGNPSAIGAVLRLEDDTGKGPVREIHAGSGYWSQDSAVQVLTFPRHPTRLWVRWPGGKVTSSALPPHARQISVDPSGKAIVDIGDSPEEHRGPD